MAWYEKWAVMTLAAAIGVAGYYGIPWRKMDATIWAYWVGAIGTITAVGVAIALAAYQNIVHERRDKLAHQESLRGLLLGIRAELSVSFVLVEKRVGIHIEAISPDSFFGIDFPIADNVLPVYHAMLPSFYLIKDHSLRVQIIQTCAIAKSLVTTFQANNALLAEYVTADSLARRTRSDIDKAIAIEKHAGLVYYAGQLKGIYAEAKTEITNLLAVLPSE